LLDRRPPERSNRPVIWLSKPLGPACVREPRRARPVRVPLAVCFLDLVAILLLIGNPSSTRTRCVKPVSACLVLRARVRRLVEHSQQ
jgi:hypothetical protein